MKQSRFLLALLPCLCLCSCASIYAIGGGGNGRGDGDPRDYDPPPAKFEYSGDIDKTDVVFGAGVAYQFSQRASAELTYVDLGEISWEGTWMGDTNVGSVDTTGLRLAFVGLHPISDSKWSMVGTGGVLFWQQDGEETLDGVPLPDIDDDGQDIFVGGGAQYSISEQMAARLTLTRYVGVGDGDIDVAMLDFLYYF